MRLKALILAVLIGLSLLVACGGGQSEGTKRLGEDMSTALYTLARCEDIHFEVGKKCPEALEVMVFACGAVIPLAEIGIEEKELGYGKVDPAMSRFCDEWDIILETPAFLADAKMIELAQDIDTFIGG